MGKSSKAPTPPDPAKTAAAQTASNISTAQANAILGNVNQVTPDGSLQFTQTGQSWIDDPNGQTFYRGPDGKIVQSAPMINTASSAPKTVQRWNANEGRMETITVKGSGSSSKSALDPSYTAIKGYYIPQTTATQTLSPQQQAIKTQQDQAQEKLATLLNTKSDWLNQYLSSDFDIDSKLGKYVDPFNGTNAETEGRLIELGRQRLDPMIAQQDESLRNRLANQGIKAGSDAYGQEQNTFNQGTNDARNQLILSGHGQAFQEGLAQNTQALQKRQQAVQEALTSRNQPLNEILALLGGTQIDQPQFVNATMPTIPTTDNAGIIQQDYQNRLGAYQQQQAQKQSMLGGLFGLGSSLIKASDKRLKENIRPIGKLMGEKIYEYNYKGDKSYQVGVMAQDVAKRRPDAVITRPDGYKAVNYGKLFEMGREMAA